MSKLITDDLYLQLEKLIQSFYKDYNISNYISNDVEFEEFYDVAICYFINNELLDKWDPERSKLSTYIYYVLKQNWPIFLYQAKYNLSYHQAKVLYRCSYDKKKTVKENYENILNTYSPLSYDINSTEDNITDSNNETWVNNIADVKTDVQKQVETKILLEKIYQILDSSLFTEKQRERLKFYISHNCSDKDTAKHFNCTRQHIHTMVQRMRKILKQKGITTKY